MERQWPTCRRPGETLAHRTASCAGTPLRPQSLVVDWFLVVGFFHSVIDVSHDRPDGILVSGLLTDGLGRVPKCIEPESLPIDTQVFQDLCNSLQIGLFIVDLPSHEEPLVTNTRTL